MDKVMLFADGACRGNPGPGGWGVLLRLGDHEKTLHGAEANTTNNRMELTAVIEGLKALKRPCVVEVVTDSQYVQRGMSEWIEGWKTRGWRGADRKPIKNIDLWQTLDQLAAGHSVTFTWVKGHAGHPENTLADALANRGIDELG